MALDFVERVKGFILNPVESFNKYKPEEFGEAFKYYLVLLLIFSVLYALIAGLGMGSYMAAIPGFGGAGMGLGMIVGIIIFFFIIGIVGLFIQSIIVHIFVAILGGKQGFTKTVAAMIYASTPSMLLGWIPIIGIIAGIWAFILEILAIREIQEMSTARAVLAIILPIIIIMVLVILLIGFFLVAAVTTAGYY